MSAIVTTALGKCARSAVAFVSAVVLSVALAGEAAAQSLIRDAEIEETLRVYTEPLLVAAGVRPEEVHIYIVNDDSVNAFVAGGQNIFVHTGLILAADNPNEVIGVLAHETGHIAGGHLARSREAINRSLGTALISIGLGVLAIAAGAPDAGAALISRLASLRDGHVRAPHAGAGIRRGPGGARLSRSRAANPAKACSTSSTRTCARTNSWCGAPRPT